MTEASPSGTFGISRDRVVLVLVALVALLAGYIIGTRDTASGGGSEFVATETTLANASSTSPDTGTQDTGTADTDTPGSTAATADGATSSIAPPETEPEQTFQFSNLPPISRSELPPEARDTLDLIASDGPYPFSKDGSTFQNREGYLPDFPRGHYREFTVITPGSNDRGARRIVAGDLGEQYYTSDHYNSFSEIIE